MLIERGFNMLDLSIIVPVYNVENYLNKCLDSLVHQTIDNYEIIVVNDGTKDNSQAIIDKYAEKYPTLIKSYIKENGGIGDARNFGVKYASGKYLAFIDSDDCAELDYYKNMCEIAFEGDLDLVVSDLEYVWENEEKPPMYKKGLSDVDGTIKTKLFLSPLFSWNKIFKRSLFIQLGCKFPVGVWYEDVPVALIYFAYADKIGYYNHIGIHYLQRSTSIMGSSYTPKMYDIFDTFGDITNFFKKKNLFQKYYKELEYLYVEQFLVYGAFRFLRCDDSHYEELMMKSFDFVKDEFPNYLKNPLIKTLGLKNNIFLRTNNRYTMKIWKKYLNKN